MLARAEMVDCKLISTPFLVGSHLNDSCTLYSVATHFRLISGVLQYLTLMRTYLSYGVSFICQYLNAPNADHYTAPKRILRYVKGTTTMVCKYQGTLLSLFLDILMLIGPAAMSLDAQQLDLLFTLAAT
ncbi:uncharacterized mitochondrial protein AtMg00810-like [Mercurialis annua]|uniref:uncharacterized mitochondrial protein AtMg00810-like n=1 Tax=Mercurialis annua TaxID=3986 RepID=UPI00216072E5|nr:uncharacterized mitochondrial protein AtMg00810-like [Mercurialis annua]